MSDPTCDWPGRPEDRPTSTRVSRIMRPARADDYAEPLRGMIERGEIEPPDESVIEDVQGNHRWREAPLG